jgi:hypothetical protein
MLPKSQWSIKPSSTFIIRFAYPDRAITDEAAAWLYYRFPWKNMVAVNTRGIIPARNRAVKNIIQKLPAKYTDIIFMDRDMRPSSLSDPFLTLPHDLACCRYNTGDYSNVHWHLPNAFHLGLCRIRRKVFERMTSGPWFDFVMRNEGCDFEMCECTYFHMNAEKLGFTSAHAGWCDHEPSGSWGH